MSSSKQKKLSPIPLDVQYYPTWFTQFRWDLSNSFFNWLYPVSPWIFGTALAGSFAYYSHASTKSFPLKFLLKDDEAEVIRLIKLSGLSLVTAYFPVFLVRSLLLKLFVFRYKGFLREEAKKPSFTTKLWAACYKGLHVFAPPRLETCDSFLPKLPVPSLTDTIDRYLESVECLLSEDEYSQVKSLAHEFSKKEGIFLQLLCKIYSLFTSNYVTGFWEKYAYLYSRKPLLVNSSVAHVDLISDVPANQAVRAAHIVYLEALNMLAIVRQRIKPLGDGLVYSGHYKKMYSTCRIPGEKVDHLKVYKTSKHVAVYLRGHIYTVDAFDEHNKLYSVDQLTQIFIELLQRGEVADETRANLPTLTHDSRDTWSKNRQKFFVQNEVNKDLLEKIESAIVFFVLENVEYDYDPKDPSQMDTFMRNMLAGDIRWADKSLNYILTKNGRVGGTTEHSIGDGAEFDHVMENFVATDINFMTYPDNVEDIDLMAKVVPEKNLKLAQRLDFEISEEMGQEIKACNARYKLIQDDLQMASLIFTNFGKGLIKDGRCSPDAFVQMAIQLANYKQQGNFVLTYESASARFFANSRTETLRTVSKQSCAFVKAMLNDHCNKADRLKLLREACTSHNLRNREVMLGNGVDRHLFVLYILSKAIGKPSPFLEYYINQPWVLSTSQPPNVTKQTDEDKNVGQTWLGASFGPVCPQGYGVCYRFAGNHTICIHISSLKSATTADAHDFRILLNESLIEMAELFKKP